MSFIGIIEPIAILLLVELTISGVRKCEYLLGFFMSSHCSKALPHSTDEHGPLGFVFFGSVERNMTTHTHSLSLLSTSYVTMNGTQEFYHLPQLLVEWGALDI